MIENTWAITPMTKMIAEFEMCTRKYPFIPMGTPDICYYGFLGGDTHQYYPELVYDNHSVEPEKTPEEGYHLTEDLSDAE